MAHLGLILALAGAARGAGFSLTAEGPFPTSATPTVRVAGSGFPYLQFRLYRLCEPETYFLSPAQPESPKQAAVEAAPARPLDAPPEPLSRLRQGLGLGWVPPYEPRAPSGPPVSTEHPLVAAWGRGYPAGSVYEDMPVPVPGPGAYLLEAVDGRETARAVVLSSDLAFEVSRTSEAVVVFVADRRTGRPWKGARVWSLAEASGPGGPLVSAGRADDGGFWRGPAAAKGLVLARSGAHFAAARAAGGD